MMYVCLEGDIYLCYGVKTELEPGFEIQSGFQQGKA
jgi:hypothetical protein